LFPYAISANFQDDLAQRPFLHGAYKVERIFRNGQSIDNLTYERLFIHRDGYLIFQDFQDNMFDYQVAIDQGKRKMTLTDYNGETKDLYFSVKKAESTLILHYSENNTPMTIELTALKWRNLPLMQKQFHWSVD
jgi:hypothetical protein